MISFSFEDTAEDATTSLVRARGEDVGRSLLSSQEFIRSVDMVNVPVAMIY